MDYDLMLTKQTEGIRKQGPGRDTGTEWEKVGGNCITRSLMVSDLLTRRTRWAGHMAPRREVKCLMF